MSRAKVALHVEGWGGLQCMWMARDDIVRLEREGGGSHIWDERQRFERKRAKIALPCRFSISGS
jgi:hypothetical protein